MGDVREFQMFLARVRPRNVPTTVSSSKSVTVLTENMVGNPKLKLGPPRNKPIQKSSYSFNVFHAF